MGKIFFSYSWAQEELVTSVANSLGRDFITQDKFNFEAGNRLDDEMKSKIKASDMFVFFLSRNSLESANVQLELDYVLPLVASHKIIFCPIYIDDELEIGVDWDRYDWIKEYLLTFTTNAPRIERILRQKIRTEWCKKFGEQPRVFYGRGKEIAEITHDFFYSVNSQRRAVIVSGIPNIGRKSLLLETLLKNIEPTLGLSYEPITVSLDENDSIDSMIEQLSEYVDIKDIDDRLAKGDYLNLLVEMLNMLQSENQKIIVDDKKSIILTNGRLVDWFLELIKHPDLASYTHFFIASVTTISPEITRKYPQVQSHVISPLNKDDMRTIFTAYARLRKVASDTTDTEYYISKFNGYPKLITNVVDDIAKSGHECAKKWLENNLKLYDTTNRELLDMIKKDDNLYQVVVVLSCFEFLSYDILCEILPEVNVLDELEKLYCWTLYDFFGGHYYRLNRSLSDYMNRNRIEIEPHIEGRIRAIGTRSVVELDDNYLDLSEKLFCLKENIRNNPKGVPTENLLPSFSLKVIIELYQKHDYENVVILAMRLMEDSHKNIYDSVKRSVIYWLCLAAARIGGDYKETFDKYVEYFFSPGGYNATHYFLKGFYARCRSDYKNAQRWYEKSLGCSKDNELKNYFAKVHHELALVYMKQDDPRALEFAKGNFEHATDNTYHIETYFRCLVRSDGADKDVLDDLLERMEHSHDICKDVIVDTFNAEYDYYIRGNHSDAIAELKDIIKRYPHTIHYPTDALRYILRIEKQKGRKITDVEAIVKQNEGVLNAVYRFDENDYSKPW